MNVHDIMLDGIGSGQMRLGLINSAWLGTAIDTARGIELTKEIGFDSIDIFADPLEITAQERRLIRKTCTAAELPVVAVVCIVVEVDMIIPPRKSCQSRIGERKIRCGCRGEWCCHSLWKREIQSISG